MTAHEEFEQNSNSPHIKEVEKSIEPEVELAQLRKELSEKEVAWSKERKDLLVQLERKNEWLNAKDEEVKLLNEKINSQRVHKVVDINTLAQLVEESLSLAEHYRQQAAKAKSEVLGNTLELQVLQSALEYARKEIHDLDETKNQLVGEYILASEQEAHSKQENKLLYRALKTLQKEASAENEKILNSDLNEKEHPELTSVTLPKISYSPNSISEKALPVNLQVTVSKGAESDSSHGKLIKDNSVPSLKVAVANKLFKVPSESDLRDKLALLPQIDPELDPVRMTPQPYIDRNKDSTDLDNKWNESTLHTPDFSPGKESDLSCPTNIIPPKGKSPCSSNNNQGDARKRGGLEENDDTVSSVDYNRTNLNQERERGYTGDVWKDSDALMRHIDPELEPEPLPNVLQHKEKESERIGHIRKLMGNFRRVKKSIAGLVLNSRSPSILALTEQMSISSDVTLRLQRKPYNERHDSFSEPALDVENLRTPKEQSPSKECFAIPEKEKMKQENNENSMKRESFREVSENMQHETTEISSKRESIGETSENLQSDTWNEKPPISDTASEQALNELSEIQSGTNGKLILTKTNISNFKRRINFLSTLSLGFFDKSRLDDIKKQLEAAQGEIDRMKKTNKKHIENALTMISKNSALSDKNEDTLRILAGAKRKLSDLGFLTELDIIAFTVESIGDEVSTMESKEMGKDGNAEEANIATETDLNFLEEMLRVLLSSHKFEEVLRIIARTKDSFTRVENINSNLRHYLHESRKVIFKQTKELRDNDKLLKMVHEHAEKLTNENETLQSTQSRAEERLEEMEKQFLIEKTTLIERVSEELHRLRCLS